MHNKRPMSLYEHGIMHKHVKFTCNKDLFSNFFTQLMMHNVLHLKICFIKRKKYMYRALQENY